MFGLTALKLARIQFTVVWLEQAAPVAGCNLGVQQRPARGVAALLSSCAW